MKKACSSSFRSRAFFVPTKITVGTPGPRPVCPATPKDEQRGTGACPWGALGRIHGSTSGFGGPEPLCTSLQVLEPSRSLFGFQALVDVCKVKHFSSPLSSVGPRTFNAFRDRNTTRSRKRIVLRAENCALWRPGKVWQEDVPSGLVDFRGQCRQELFDS